MPDLRESIIQALKDEGYVVLSPDEFEEKMVSATESFRTALNVEPEKKKGKKWSYAAKQRLKERRAGKAQEPKEFVIHSKKASSIAMRCLKAVADGNHWQTQIADASGIGVLGLALRLNPLLRRGWLSKPKSGYYEITNEGRKALEEKPMVEVNGKEEEDKDDADTALNEDEEEKEEEETEDEEEEEGDKDDE